MTSETPEYIVESEVTPETIHRLFTRAFYSTHMDDDEDIIVNADPISVYISINKNTKLLKYTAPFRIDPDAPLALKHVLANKMNDDVILCRFSIPDDHDDMLVADYFLSFGESISSFQIVSTLRLFVSVVSNAIGNCDDNDLIK